MKLQAVKGEEKIYHFSVEPLEEGCEAYDTYGHRIFFQFITPEGSIWPNFASVPNLGKLERILHIVREEIQKKIGIPITEENSSVSIRAIGITKEYLFKVLKGEIKEARRNPVYTTSRS